MNRHSHTSRRTRQAIAAELLAILEAADDSAKREAAGRLAPDAECPFWRGYVDSRVRDLAERLVTR